MRSLLLALALAAPAFGQFTATWGQTETIYTGGGFQTRGGVSKAKGTSGSFCATDNFVGAVGLWDLGDARTLVKGGYDLVPADDDYFTKTTGTIPCVSSGTPSYPFTIFVWCKTDTTAVADRELVNLQDGSDTHRIILYNNGAVWRGYRQDGGANQTISTAASSVTAGRWHRVVLVVTSTSSFGVYADTDTTGATGSTTVAPTGIDNLFVGRNASAGAEWDGVIALTAILPGAASANQRTAFFAGADPELVMGGVGAGAVYPLDNDSGADRGPNGLNLTSSGTPAAQNNLLAVRDKSGGGYHLLATTAAPTWSSSIGNGQGGGVFASASTQFLIRDATPVTAAPFQIYVVAQANNITAAHTTFCILDKDVNDDDAWPAPQFRGDFGGDPIRITSLDSSATSANTSTGYSADTNYLLWALEASNVSRSVEINGGSTGTDTNDRSPDNADRLSMGGKIDTAADGHLDGEIHWVLLLNVSSTADQARIERFASTAFALGF